MKINGLANKTVGGDSILGWIISFLESSRLLFLNKKSER